ncbi:hypothetical protein BH23ACI1_BH23ACI1_00660 [soil metagenome]|nr:hypothetical protein [Acidobacteriota bacterium]
MPELSENQRDLQTLVAELKRLEAEYNGYFSGRERRPPFQTRSRVEALMKRLDRGGLETSIDRFRFQSLQARFQTFVELWDRSLRAREEGRPGPFRQALREAVTKKDEPESRVLHVTAFSDPLREMDKLHSLYDSLMDARRQSGDDAVPFHRFAALVKDQVSKLRDAGNVEVAFRVVMKEGKVNFTARGLKAGEG